jgi:ubiquinone/menaquinone biosynthesis C-methylase UbiE
MRGSRLARRLRGDAEPSPQQPEPSAPRSPESQWFWDHYESAAGQVIQAFTDVGRQLGGKIVADIGCGDGFIDLGVAQRGAPQRLVGFDVNLTNQEHLARRAAEEGVAPLPPSLSFERSDPTRIPAEDASFDVAFSWSAFEHIPEPVAVLREIRRVLRADGAFFLQLWPFYQSAKGSHLWEWFPEDFHHLQRAESEITEEILASDLKERDWTEMMAREFRHLNRITVEELQRSLLAAGFVTRRLELISDPTILTPELSRYSWLDLGVSGIKLIATPS